MCKNAKWTRENKLLVKTYLLVDGVSFLVVLYITCLLFHDNSYLKIAILTP